MIRLYAYEMMNTVNAVAPASRIARYVCSPSWRYASSGPYAEEDNPSAPRPTQAKNAINDSLWARPESFTSRGRPNKIRRARRQPFRGNCTSLSEACMCFPVPCGCGELTDRLRRETTFRHKPMFLHPHDQHRTRRETDHSRSQIAPKNQLRPARPVSGDDNHVGFRLSRLVDDLHVRPPGGDHDVSFYCVTPQDIHQLPQLRFARS